MSVRVLAVEDEPGMQVILRDNLEHEGYEVLSAATGDDGFRLAMLQQPDLILLDVMLPRMNGYDLCRRLRAEQVSTPIIMLTAKNEELDRVLGLDMGADDYVGKPFGVGELIARIRVQLRRTRHSRRRPLEVRFGDVFVDLRVRRAWKGADPLALSSREFDLLEYLVDHMDKPVTRDELLNAVWGYSTAPMTRTVDNFVAKVRKKIEDDPRDPRHILTVHGSGYRFVP